MNAMRKACHNILYTVVNSRAYNEENAYFMVLWKKILIMLDVLAAVILVVIEILTVRKYRKIK